jgi:hypothetical protein
MRNPIVLSVLLACLYLPIAGAVMAGEGSPSPSPTATPGPECKF